MTELLMTKNAYALRPTDQDGMLALQSMSENAIVKVTLFVPRNPRQWRLFQAMVQLGFEHQKEPRVFATREDLRKYLIIKTGHFDLITRPNGETFPEARSLAFGALDQVEWLDFWPAAKLVFREQIISGIGDGDLEQALSELLREISPADLRR